MAKKKIKKTETDSAYFLKLVLYMVLGAQWVFIVHTDSTLPVPVGLILGLVFTTHEHFKVDRKIEYAILLMSALVGYWSGIGLSVS